MSSSRDEARTFSIEDRRLQLIKMIDEFGKLTDFRYDLEPIHHWQKDMKVKLGLEKKSITSGHEAEVTRNGRKYLLLLESLREFHRHLHHTLGKAIQIDYEKKQWSVLPRWTAEGILRHIDSIYLREKWSLKLSIVFVKIVHQGLEHGIKENALDNWRNSARATFKTSEFVDDSCRPRLAETEEIVLSVATNQAEYSAVHAELANLLEAIQKHPRNVYEGGFYLEDAWQPRAMQERIKEALKPRPSSPSRTVNSLSVFQPSGR